MASTTERISYDTGVSQSVQGDIQNTVGQLEQLIAARNKQVADAMSDFQAQGVSEEYQGVETKWHNAAGEVQGIINLVKTTLHLNDETAGTAGKKARQAVMDI